jgi:RNA polymerase sigma-70 factor, ECF subfamily
MSIPRTDAINEIPFPGAAREAISATWTDVENEVIKLFDQFRVPLLRYTLSLGLQAHDGEETVQEVFLALFRHLNLGKSRKNLRGWLFCVAHNLALKRRQNNRRLQDQPLFEGAVVEGQSDPSPNPEEQVLAAQRERRLLGIVHTLPEQDQYCLRLRAEGLRYREIARVLGISLGTVSLSLTRSLARLMRADEV